MSEDAAGAQGQQGQPQGQGPADQPAGMAGGSVVPPGGVIPPGGVSDGASGGAEDQGAQAILDELMQRDPEELSRQLIHWRTEARKLERTGRDNAKAAKELKRIQDAGKTEVQRAQEAQATAEHERDEALATHNRVMAAAAHDLPVELIDHLGAGTAEEISERAELFAKVINERAQKMAEQIAAQYGVRFGNGSGGMRPVESLRSGASPAQGGQPMNNEQYFRQLLNQQRE